MRDVDPSESLGAALGAIESDSVQYLEIIRGTYPRVLIQEMTSIVEADSALYRFLLDTRFLRESIHRWTPAATGTHFPLVVMPCFSRTCRPVRGVAEPDIWRLSYVYAVPIRRE